MKVMRSNKSHCMFRWWGPEDNKALLSAYWRIGASLSGAKIITPALDAFAEHLINSSDSTVDFTVRVSARLNCCCKLVQMAATSARQTPS